MSSVSFLVEPLEALFFGPPRSGTAGEAHHVHSMVAPPTAFQGMVRTRLLHALLGRLPANAAEAERVIGSPDALPSGWQLTGPQLAEVVKGATVPWLPVPTFAAGTAPIRLDDLRRADTTGVTGDPPCFDDLALGSGPSFERLLVPALGRPKGSPVGWARPAAVRRWLSGAAVPESDLVSDELPPFVCREERSGVAIDPETGTALDDHLYVSSQLRFAPESGLLGTLAGELPDGAESALTTGAGSAGRRERVVRFTTAGVLDANWLDLLRGVHLVAPAERWCLAWMLAISPARVGDPWALGLRYPGVTARVCAARLAPPITLGGYAIARRQTRPNRVYAGRGSAWLVHVQGRTPADCAEALRAWNGRCVLGPEPERAFGYGQVLVGAPLLGQFDPEAGLRVPSPERQP